MRTQDEIVQKIKDSENGFDIFDIVINDSIIFLDFDHAQEFLNKEVTKEEWVEDYKEMTDEVVLEYMKDYMDFAWGKANGCRGLSAERSMMHYNNWFWLLNDGGSEKIETEDYQYYGKDVLVQICERYGWDHNQWDDGIRSNSEY